MFEIINVEKNERDLPKPGRWGTKGLWKDYEKQPRCYFWVEGETVLDHLFNRHFEPWREYRKVMPEVLSRVGIDPDIKYNWSKYAGCSCPCSPGFILHTEGYEDGHFDIWVTVTWEEEE